MSVIEVTYKYSFQNKICNEKKEQKVLRGLTEKEDKGNAIVVMNKAKYEEDVREIVSGKEFV